MGAKKLLKKAKQLLQKKSTKLSQQEALDALQYTIANAPQATASGPPPGSHHVGSTANVDGSRKDVYLTKDGQYIQIFRPAAPTLAPATTPTGWQDESKFKAGDTVRCIKGAGTRLVQGGTYTVRRVQDTGSLNLIECDEDSLFVGWDANRFVLEESTLSQSLKLPPKDNFPKMVAPLPAPYCPYRDYNDKYNLEEP